MVIQECQADRRFGRLDLGHVIGHIEAAYRARCSGIYFGFFIGVLLSPVLSRRVLLPPRSAWIIAAFPMLLDVGADLLGVHAGTIPTRLASGAFFGIGAALILTPLMITACSELFDQHRRWHHGSKT